MEEKILKPATEKLKDMINVSEIKKEPKVEPSNVKIVPINISPVSPSKTLIKGDIIPSTSRIPQFTNISTIAKHSPTF